MVRRKFLVLLLLGLLAPLGTFSIHAQSSLRITNLSASASGVVLGWQNSATGTAYTVQFQDTLQDGIWRLTPSQQAFPVASNQWTDFWPTKETRFYRVVEVPLAQRGKVLSNTLATTFTKFYLGFVFGVGGVPITPQYDVRAYKVTYETITPLGARIEASGALLLPEGT